MASNGLSKMCTPALIYLSISMFSIIVMIYQSFFHNVNVLTIGNYNSYTSSNIQIIFLIKILYILFWTWILNLICRAGAPLLSWILVIMPLVIFYMATVMMTYG
jgi:hypothetical protein